MRVYRIAKTFRFEAAHQLSGLPDGHQCGRLHGHSYVVQVRIQGRDPLPESGMLVDFGDLSPIKSFIDERLDHRSLNDLVAQPTAENLARWLFVQWEQLVTDLGGQLAAVRVHETVNCWAEYSA